MIGFVGGLNAVLVDHSLTPQGWSNWDARTRWVLGKGTNLFGRSAPLLAMTLLVSFTAAMKVKYTIAAVLSAAATLIAILIVALLFNATGVDFLFKFWVVMPVGVVTTLLAGAVWFNPAKPWFLLPDIHILRRARSTACPRGLRSLANSAERNQCCRDRRMVSWREAVSTGKWFWPAALAVTALAPAWPVQWGLVAPLLCGLLAFRSEHLRDRIRFLSERGVGVSPLWLGKQRVWLPRAIIASLLGYFGPDIVAYLRGYEWNSPAPWQLGNWLLASLAAYAIGQACSLWFRQFVVAIAVAALLGIFLTTWMRITSRCVIPSAISLVPVTLGFLLASWRSCQDWMDGRTSSSLLRNVATIATSALVVWVVVAVFQVLEVPDTYNGTAGNRFLRDHGQRRNSTPTLAEVQSLSSTKDTNAYLALANELSSGELPTFCPIDTTPRSWKQLDDRTRSWVKRFSGEVPRVRALIGEGGGLSFVGEGPSGSDASLFAAKGPFADGFAFLAPMQNFEHPGVTQHGYSLCNGKHYLPLILLELEGARLHDEGEYDEALKLYSAAVRGYWCIVRSPHPGQDLIHAYAGAGQVFRRMGQCGCDASLERWVERKEPWWAVHPAELALESSLSEAPSLEQVNNWVREATAARSKTGVRLTLHSQATLGPRYLISPAIQYSPQELHPDFSFGLRQRRISEWFQQGRTQTIQNLRMTSNQVLASMVTRSDMAWRVQSMQWSRDSQAQTVNNPVAWVLARQNMKTDWEAALQMIHLGEAARWTPVSASDAMLGLLAKAYESGRTFTETPVFTKPDPWSGERFVLDLQGLTSTEIMSARQFGLPENHPVMISAGGPTERPSAGDRKTPWSCSGGRRYYPLPSRFLRQLKASGADERE